MSLDVTGFLLSYNGFRRLGEKGVSAQWLGKSRWKKLKIPRWQRRVGSSPTARTSLRSRGE
jgi:hypothetical protein